jgi:hypothetical protein
MTGTRATFQAKNEGEKMNSKRLTIFCVALVALAGAPRAWQEAGKLLAAVQHKAQVKFWSMVMQPKTPESASLELIAAAEPARISPASFDSNCPLAAPGAAVRDLQARSHYKAERKAAEASAQSQRSAERQQSLTAAAPLSHAGLIAKALKAPRGDSHAESLRHSQNIPLEVRLSAVAESRTLLAYDGRATAPLSPPSGKGDTFKFLTLPTVNPVASALIDKDTALRLKMLRKPMEEPKLIRQKTRLPVMRGTVSYFPAS